jgi:tetratricopeptide (TPR) repeat protein
MMNDASDELLGLALQARRENRLADAKRHLEEAVNLCRETDAKNGLAKALTRLGAIERDLGNKEPSLKHYEEAAGIYRGSGDAQRLAHTIRHMADINLDAGHTERAEPCYREALTIYRSQEKTPPLDLANAIRGFALLKGRMGEAAEATALWTEARALYSAVNVQAGVDESTRQLARLNRSQV